MKKDRVFTVRGEDGKDLTLIFKRPSQSILSKAHLVFRKAYSNGLREGYLLAKEVDNILRARGLWSDEKDKEVDALRLEISSLEDKLNDSGLSDEEGRQVCESLIDKREELFDINSMVSSIADNTCEAIAAEEKNYFLAANCVYNSTGLSRVYKSVEDYKARLDEPGATDCYREALIAGLEASLGRELPSDLTEEYAENKWLSSKVEQVKVEPKKKKKSSKRTSSS